MKNTLGPGKTLTIVAPSGGLLAGQGYLQGTVFGVVINTTEATKDAVLALEGEYALSKATGVTVAQGQALYWDAANNRVTPTHAPGLPLVGCATEAAGSSAVSVGVLLRPVISQPSFDPGIVVTVLAPSGGVTAGQVRLIGDGLFGVILDTAAAGASTRVQVRGTFTLPKTSTEEMAVGDILYWDGTVATADPSAGDLRIGVCLEARANPTSTVSALLVGVGEPLVVDTTE